MVGNPVGPGRPAYPSIPAMTVFLWTLLAFFSGALPFSVWLGRLALRTDIRRYGDGNPGGANLWRAGGAAWGLAGILLDYAKGALPVALAHFAAGVQDWALVPVALAPVLGHAYTPFLRGRGGKALAVTFGVWTGISLWSGPVVLGLAFGFWLFTVRHDGWTVMLGMATLLVALLAAGAGLPWLTIWAGNTALLAWKHRQELRRPPDWRRGWIGRLARTRKGT